MTPGAKKGGTNTPAQIMASAEPCEEWEIERVEALFRAHNRTSVTARDVLECSDLSDMVDACTARLFVCHIAELALERYGNGDERSAKAIEVARRYAIGLATGEELAAATAAARAAAAGDESRRILWGML